MANNEDNARTPGDAMLSRRGFLGASGATAVAVAGLGSAAGVAGLTSTAGAAIADRTYFSSIVGLELDGATAGIVESAEGGEPAFKVASGVGGQVSLAGPMHEPLTLVLHRHSRAFYDWITQSTLGKAVPTRSLAVVCYDLESREWYRLSLENARIVEVQADAIDIARPDRARLRIKVVAARTRHRLATQSPGMLPSFKLMDLLQANCRFVLDSSREFSSGVRVIEPVIVQVGADGVPVVGPIRLEVNPTALAPAYAWMDKALAGTFEETNGSLQMWSRDLTKVLASVNFTGLGILRATAPVKPSAGTTPLAAVELYCRTARFNLAGLA